MPRNNPFKNRTTSDLVMEYVLRITDSKTAPLKMYSTKDLIGEIEKRIPEKGERYDQIHEAQAILKIIDS